MTDKKKIKEVIEKYGSAESAWSDDALFVIQELKRRGAKFPDISRALAELGITKSAAAIRSKLRGLGLA